MGRMSSHVYRHRPWLAWSVVLLLLLAAMLAPFVLRTAREPGIATVAGLFTAALPIGALAAFLVLGFRVRTEIDHEGLTQHWITTRYRIPFDEITAVEWDESGRRWFLRVWCGDRSFEVMPCQTLGPFAPKPPHAMVAVSLAIDDHLARVTGT